MPLQPIISMKRQRQNLPTVSVAMPCGKAVIQSLLLLMLLSSPASVFHLVSARQHFGSEGNKSRARSNRRSRSKPLGFGLVTIVKHQDCEAEQSAARELETKTSDRPPNRTRSDRPSGTERDPWTDRKQYEESSDESFLETDHDNIHSHANHADLLQIPCRLSVAKAHSAESANGGDVMNSNRLVGKEKSHEICTICDTGAQRTVLSFRSAQAMGLLHYMDRRYQAYATGVGGTVNVLGRIPAGAAVLELRHVNNGNPKGSRIRIPCPAITVLKDSPIHDSRQLGKEQELLLGLDFLREHDCVLDVASNELQLTVQDEEGYPRPIRIPFLRPRGSSNRSLFATTSQSSDPPSHDEPDEEYEEMDDDDEYDNEETPVDMSGV